MSGFAQTLPIAAGFLLSVAACGSSPEPATREIQPPDTRDGVGTQRPAQLSLSVRVSAAPSKDELVHTALVAVVRDMDGHVSETDLGEFIGKPVDANPTRAGEILTLQLPEDSEAEALHFMLDKEGGITVFTEAPDGSITETHRLEMPSLGKVKRATPALEHDLHVTPVATEAP